MKIGATRLFYMLAQSGRAGDLWGASVDTIHEAARYSESSKQKLFQVIINMLLS